MFKPQDLSSWLWTVLVTFTILASIPPNIQGTICYSCETPYRGRKNEAKEEQQNTGNATGRLFVSYKCATTEPEHTRICSGDCYYQVDPTKSGGTAYYRDCGDVPHELGCKKFDDGVVNCYCDKSLCNNKLSYGLRSSDYSIATTLGPLIVLFSM